MNEFDEKFANAGGDYDGSLKPLKLFLRQAIKQAFEETRVEEPEEFKNDYMGYGKGYSTAISEVKKRQEEFLKE